jgi:creatinine amidohydrolase
MLLEDMTWNEARDAIAANTPYVFPTGSVEQHGYHLPLSTDTITALGLSVRLAERRPLVVAPPLVYTPHSRPSVGGGGKGFAGSIGVPPSVLVAMLQAIICDVMRQGVKRVLLINGHFENVAPGIEALEYATEMFPGTKAALITWTDVITVDDLIALGYPDPVGFRGWDYEHAGLTETSYIASMRPDLVHHGSKHIGGVDRRATYEVFPLPDDLVAPSGMMGSGEYATAEYGSALTDLVVDRLEAAIARELGAE